MPGQMPARPAPASTASTAPGRRAGRLAWALLGLAIVLMASSLVLAFTGGETWNAKFATMPVALVFVLVGALIAARTGNRLGWLFLAAGLVDSASLLAYAYAARTGTAQLPGAAWAAWVFTVILGISGTLFFLTPLLFPDGRPPSRRWWPVVWVAIIAGLAQMVTVAVSDANFSNNFPELRDPVTLVAPLGGAYNLGPGGRATGVAGRRGRHYRPFPPVGHRAAAPAQVVHVRHCPRGGGRLRRRLRQ